MPRFSCSLSDEQNDWLEAEGDRRDRSKADVVRQCIDAVRTGSVQTDEDHTEPVTTGEHRPGEIDRLRDRVDELEQRLDRLEADTEPVDSGPEPQPSGAEDDVVAWVRKHQPASRSEIVDAHHEAIDREGIKPDSWWRRRARPQLEESGFEYVRNVGWRKR